MLASELLFRANVEDHQRRVLEPARKLVARRHGVEAGLERWSSPDATRPAPAATRPTTRQRLRGEWRRADVPRAPPSARPASRPCRRHGRRERAAPRPSPRDAGDEGRPRERAPPASRDRSSAAGSPERAAANRGCARAHVRWAHARPRGTGRPHRARLRARRRRRRTEAQTPSTNSRRISLNSSGRSRFTRWPTPCSSRTSNSLELSPRRHMGRTRRRRTAPDPETRAPRRWSLAGRELPRVR